MDGLEKGKEGSETMWELKKKKNAVNVILTILLMNYKWGISIDLEGVLNHIVR